MKTMRGVAVLAPGVVRVVDDIPMPEIGPYECLVKIHACGFCSGTDMRIITGTLGSGLGPFPTILGHEAAGEVVALGEKVRYISIGDRWVHPSRYPWLGNGYSRTYGNMAEYALVNDDRAMLEDGFSELPFAKQHPFPKQLEYPDACLIISLSECHSAVKNFGIGPGARVLIFGAGPMGIALALFSKLAGAARIVQADHHEERLARAVQIAAVDQTVNSAAVAISEKLAGEEFDFVIDAVGSTAILLEGAAYCKPGGKLCSFGTIRRHDRFLDITQLPRHLCLHMLNDPYGEYAIMDETIALILHGKVNPKDFYSHVLPMERIDRAIELVERREAIKVVLTVGGSDKGEQHET